MIAMTPAIKIAAITPTIKSLPSPLTDVSEDFGVDSTIHAPSWRIVPGPHLSSNTQAPSWRIVPGPHWVFGVLSTGVDVVGSGVDLELFSKTVQVLLRHNN